MDTTGIILLEHGPGEQPTAFTAPRAVVVARHADDVAPALARLDAARAAGQWIAGWIGYEAGLALEPKLARLMPEGGAPLLAFGIYDAPGDAAALLDQASAQAAGDEEKPPPHLARVAWVARVPRAWVKAAFFWLQAGAMRLPA